jgi:hypothetical protein
LTNYISSGSQDKLWSSAEKRLLSITISPTQIMVLEKEGDLAKPTV